jgi:hypothetical protein
MSSSRGNRFRRDGRKQLGSAIGYGHWLLKSPLPPTRFVIFAAEHCGADLLLELLPPTVQCDRNLLTNRQLFPLLHIRRHAVQSPSPIYGVQVSSTDLLQGQGMSDPAQFMAMLHRQGYRIIHLQRRNLLRHAIALIRSDLGYPTRQPLRIDPADLMHCLKQLEQQQIEAAATLAEIPCLQLSYEADLLNPNVHAATARRLHEFLDLPWESLPLHSLKLVHQHLSDLVENYTEVEASLEPSEFAYVLAEELAPLVMG